MSRRVEGAARPQRLDGTWVASAARAPRISGKQLDMARHLQGRRVSVALCDGSRIDDCQLVSTGRGDRGTLWLYDRQDLFVPLHQVIDLWESTPLGHRAA